MSDFRTILVPVDFSSHASSALKLAVRMAQDSSATVHVLHAYALPLALNSPYPVKIPESVLEALREEAARKLEETLDEVSASGVKFEKHLVQASPAAGIVDAARDLEVDLIVMGTRGLTGLAHVLLGSVAERTLRAAPCPVLTVKSDED